MNKVILIGRLTKDPEVRNTSSQVSVCRFTLAVDRRFKDQNGQRQADFINCVAWRQTANFISSYFHKGSRIAIVGNIQTRNYDDNSGQKHYVTEVVVDEAEFVDSANSGNQGRSGNSGYGNSNYGNGAGGNNGAYSNSGSSYSAPADSAAYSAPTSPLAPVAPNKQIPAGASSESYHGSDDDMDLPFPIDEDTGNLSF